MKYLIEELMKSNFGNFVMQKALKIASNNNRNILLDLMIKNLSKLGDNKLICKWQEIINSYSGETKSKNMYNRNSSFDKFF
jgi:hypothetical protein